MATATDPYPPEGTQYPAVNSINDDIMGPPQPTVTSPPIIKIYQGGQSDQSGKSCCNGLYSCCGALFCFKKNQGLMSKLGVTWLWAFLIPIAIGLLLGLYVFAPYSFVSAPGDQRIVMGRYDSFFCDAIKVDSTQRFDAYLLGKTPTILQNNRSYTSVDTKNITIPENSYAVWNFYLLEGSDLGFQICNSKPMEFFMLKGEGNYKKWKKDTDNCNCEMQHASFPNGSSECTKTTNIFTYNFTTSIEKTDEYYLAFQNPSDLDMNEMNLKVKLNRSSYDIYNNVKSSCRNRSSCELSIGFFSSESIVYVSLDQKMFNVNNNVKCNPTWAVYLSIFGAIPMIVGFSASLLLFILFMHCPGAWEGVHRPKALDDERTQKGGPSILDTLAEEEKKSEKKGKKGSRLFGKNSRYDTLSEEESGEESMETFPRNSPPASSNTFNPQPDNQAPDGAQMSVPVHDMNGVASVEVHAIP